MMDWLEEFVQYSSYGEASPRLMYWVGVSTIAGALRRKVWFNMGDFQWSPNFYILVVGEAGTVRKSTSMDIGVKFLRRLDSIHLGPSMVTWQALVQYIAEHRDDVLLPDGSDFEMSPVTLAISEFGAFFDPANRELVDALTDLWDGKLGIIEKMTKTSGHDIMVNPWINLIAATTPKWLAEHFSEGMVGGGLAGRFIFLYGEMPTKDIAYPKLHMGDMEERRRIEMTLLDRLRAIANYGGEYELTPEAYEWGDEWYKRERAILRQMTANSLERGFIVRKQVHLHKLAMVISAARGDFPSITLDHLLEAERQLKLLDDDTKEVFGFVGQTKLTTASREIVEAVKRMPNIEKRQLYRNQFWRTMSKDEFNEAVQSAVQAELIVEILDTAKPLLAPR